MFEKRLVTRPNIPEEWHFKVFTVICFVFASTPSLLPAVVPKWSAGCGNFGEGGGGFARLCKASVAPKRLENAGLNDIVFSTYVIVTALHVSQLRGCRNLRDISHTLYRIASQQGSDVSFVNDGVAVNDTASVPMALGSRLWASFYSLRNGRVSTVVRSQI